MAQAPAPYAGLTTGGPGARLSLAPCPGLGRGTLPEVWLLRGPQGDVGLQPCSLVVTSAGNSGLWTQEHPDTTDTGSRACPLGATPTPRPRGGLTRDGAYAHQTEDSLRDGAYAPPRLAKDSPP